MRDATGRFLVEGPQALGAALRSGAAVRELFATEEAAGRHRPLLADAEAHRVPVSLVTEDAIGALAETVHPQGLVAVCDQMEVPLAALLSRPPELIVVLVEIREPGNAGTVLRTADAAGAGAVIFAGAAVDPYNGKCVRASAGSLFHLPVARAPEAAAVVPALREAGLRVLATTGGGEHDLDTLLTGGGLAEPTAWLFGSEAHGLPDSLRRAADARVRVPIYGRAESLNLGAAAAVCLYASARALRQEESGA